RQRPAEPALVPSPAPRRGRSVGLTRCSRSVEAGGATVQRCGWRRSQHWIGSSYSARVGRWAAPSLFRQFGHQLLLAVGEFLAHCFGIHAGGGELGKEFLFLFLDVPLYHLFEDSDPGIKQIF